MNKKKRKGVKKNLGTEDTELSEETEKNFKKNLWLVSLKWFQKSQNKKEFVENKTTSKNKVQ